MLKATVVSSETRNMQGLAKLTNKPYSMFIQTVYFHTFDKSGNPNPFPEKAEIILEKDEVGNPKYYAVGEYVLHPSSLYLDRNGSLVVAPKLVPARKSA